MTPKNISIASLIISLFLVSMVVLSYMENKKKKVAATEAKQPCSCTDHIEESNNYPGGTVHSQA